MSPEVWQRTRRVACLREYRKLTLAEIATILDLSKERVWQLYACSVRERRDVEGALALSYDVQQELKDNLRAARSAAHEHKPDWFREPQ